MAISAINLPAPAPLAKTQSGTITTDAAGAATAATTSNTGVNATVIVIGSTAGYTGADVITVPGAGPSGADKELLVSGASLQGAGQLTIPNPGIVTSVATGAIISRWDRLDIAGRPRHVRATRRDNGDFIDWVAGMEPYSANVSTGGAVTLMARVMLCQAGAVHFAPGVLAASQLYDILVEF